MIQKKELRLSRGITLIALVVTIIVLLILAGVTINLVLGEDGIIAKAEKAKLAQILGEYKDKIEIAKATVALDEENLGKVPLTSLKKELEKMGMDVTETGTGENMKLEVTVPGIEEKIIITQDGNNVNVKYPDDITGDGSTDAGQTQIVAVKNVILNNVSANINIGENLTLTETIEPSNATNKNVTWSSTDESIATVSNGVITGIGVGNAIITVTTEDGGKQATCAVTVVPQPSVSVQNVTLNQTNANIKVGGNLTLTAMIEPANATNGNVTWSSADESIATVNNGVITGVGAGSTIITATTEDGGKQATCTVLIQPSTVEQLKKGNYINYIDKKGTTRLCLVLYDLDYELVENCGVQIITDDIVENVELGNGTGETKQGVEYFNIAMNEYNAAISILNTKAREYLNTTYASDARCLGTIPNNPDYELNEYFTSSYPHMSSYNGKLKKGYRTYNPDYYAISDLEIWECSGDYWYASREVSDNSYATAFRMELSKANGAIGATSICEILENGSIYAESREAGVRPVFTLKPGTAITGGSGTEKDPYTMN